MPHTEDVPIDDVGSGQFYDVSVTRMIPRNSAGPGLHFRTLYNEVVPVGEFLCVEVSGIIGQHPGQRVAEYFEGLGFGARPQVCDAIVRLFCEIYRTDQDYSTEMLAQVHVQTCYEDEEYEYGFEFEIKPAGGDQGLRARNFMLDVVTVGLDTEATSCAICLDEFSSGLDVIELPCSHVYHKHCIRRWFEKRLDCPLCRFELPLMPTIHVQGA